MPSDFDENLRRILIEAFEDSASNVPEFTETAITGGHRRDEGLNGLLPPEWSIRDKKATLKFALHKALVARAVPTVKHETGDSAMSLDAATDLHFRGIVVSEMRLFVKIRVDLDVPDDPVVTIQSVKRDDKG